MTFLILHAKHHAMVTQAEVDILQSVSDEGTALTEFDGDDGQVVRLLVSLGQRQHFLFASGTQGLDGFAAIWDYVISIAEDAEVLARELGYNGPSVF